MVMPRRLQLINGLRLFQIFPPKGDYSRGGLTEGKPLFEEIWLVNFVAGSRFVLKVFFWILQVFSHDFSF